VRRETREREEELFQFLDQGRQTRTLEEDKIGGCKRVSFGMKGTVWRNIWDKSGKVEGN